MKTDQQGSALPGRMPPLIIRWTVGDVSEYGFAALRMSLCGMWRLFGEQARYVVCVNTVPILRVQELTGDLPAAVTWRDTTEEFPRFLEPFFDEHKAEGVGWKFAPLQLDPACRELALDNDCILWRLPRAIERWLQMSGSFLLAEDVKACFGQFSEICGLEPRNSGIRGLPAGFDLERALLEVLNKHQLTLCSELDEQGLQTAVINPYSPSSSPQTK